MVMYVTYQKVYYTTHRTKINQLSYFPSTNFTALVHYPTITNGYYIDFISVVYTSQKVSSARHYPPQKLKKKKIFMQKI